MTVSGRILHHTHDVYQNNERVDKGDACADDSSY